MARKIGLAFVAIFLLFVLTLGGATGYLYIKRAKVLDRVQQIVADQFTTRVAFSDDVGVDVFSTFPRIGIELRDVFVQGAHGTDTLLHAQKLAASINLIDLIFGRGVNVTGLTASHGTLKVIQTKKGWSYDVFRPNNNRDTTSGADIDRLRLRNVNVRFATRQTQIAAFANDAKIVGHVLAAERDLAIDLNMDLHQITAQGFVIDTLVPLEATARLKVSRGAKLISVENGSVALNGASVKWSGLWETGTATQTSMKFQADAIEVGRLLPIWASAPKALRDLNPIGQISANVEVSGELGGKRGPKLVVNGSARALAIRSEKGKVEFASKAISISMTEVSNLESFEAQSEKVEVRMGDSQAEVKVQLRNLINPEYQVSASGEFSIEDLVALAGNSTMANGRGQIEFDLVAEGKLNGTHNLAHQLAHQHIELKATISKGGIVVNGLPEIAGVNGQVEVDRQGAVQIDLKSGGLGSLDLSASLQAQGAIEVLLGGNAITTVSGKMTVGRFDVRQVGRDWVNDNSPKTNKTETSALPVRLDIDLTVDQLLYDDFTADHVQGRILLDQNGLTATNIKAECLGGSVEAQVKVLPTTELTNVVLAATVSDLDIQRTFREWANFGQTSITYKNLRGTASANVLVEMKLGPDLAILPNAIVADADLTIKNGELVNFTPLKSLSKFIDVSELEHVKFDDLSNRLSIRDGKLSIPYMTVRSSILTLDVYGDQAFKGEMDYHVNLLLNEVLGRKARKKQPQEFDGHTIVEEEGKTRLFLWVRGTPTDVKVGFDKKEVRKKVAKEMKAEGETLRQLFKDEFKIKQRPTDTLRTTAPAPSEKKPKPTTEGGWEIDF